MTGPAIGTFTDATLTRSAYMLTDPARLTLLVEELRIRAVRKLRAAADRADEIGAVHTLNPMLADVMDMLRAADVAQLRVHDLTREKRPR